MNRVLDVALPSGLLIAFILVGLAIMAFVLVIIARRLYRNDLFSFSLRRHAYLKRSDIRFQVVLNSGSKDRRFRGFEIYAKGEEDRILVAKLNGYPLGNSLASPCVGKIEEEYYVDVPSNKQREVVFVYELVGSLEDLRKPLVMEISDGEKTYEAPFQDFESLDEQELVFRVKPKTGK